MPSYFYLLIRFLVVKELDKSSAMFDVLLKRLFGDLTIPFRYDLN